jgi:uncharacterized protein
MSRKPYDYENRQGVRPISWEEFHGICKGLVKAVSRFDPEIILSVGRGGYYPGTLISHILQVEIYPVRLSRRVNDIPTYASPRWLLKPPKLVKGRRVLVVDEICGSGETILMVKHEAERLGASEVRSAVMYAHTWGTSTPDYIGLVSDELILNPWDREIFKDGTFQFHPEYVEALAQQGLPADPSLLVNAQTIEPTKSRR